MLQPYSMEITVIVNNNLVYRTFTPMFISEIEFIDVEKEYDWVEKWYVKDAVEYSFFSIIFEHSSDEIG